MTALPPPTNPRKNNGEPSRERTAFVSWPAVLLLLAFLAAIWLWPDRSEDTARKSVDYSEFYQWLENGEVQSVTLRGTTVEGERKSPVPQEEQTATPTEKASAAFKTRIPDNDEELLPLLRKQQVSIRVDTDSDPLALQILFSLLPWILIIGIWVWLSRRARNMMSGGGPFGGVLKTKSRKFERDTSVNVTFDDVAGLESAKADLQEVVQFLREPERFRRLGGKVPRGVLLVGPPGTGKTLLARAVAGESEVPFFTMSASEFIELFVGVGASRVRELFEEAKKSAPSIVFIDEIDAVGRSRGAGLGGGNDEREQTLNQLLSEMDGFDRNDLTIVLAATNRPDVLDPALVRPGRFDRRVIVDRPERGAREAILKVHTKKKPIDDDVDLESIAANTPGFSGADLANLVNEATLRATKRGADSICAEDFAEAFDKIVLGDPRETKLDTEEKHRVAVHESGHAVLAYHSTHAETLRRVSIIPRGMALGVTQQTPASDRHLLTRAQLAARLRVLMGGYAAEQVILGEVSSGAESDLKEATDLAFKMVANYGMSDALGPVYYEHHAEHGFLGQRIATESGTSDATVHAIEHEAGRILRNALSEAIELIESKRAQVDALIEALLERETLEEKELLACLSSARDEVEPIVQTKNGLC